MKKVRRLTHGKNMASKLRMREAEKICHKLLKTVESTGHRLPCSAASSLFFSLSLLRANDYILVHLMRHALNDARNLTSENIIDLLRGVMLWQTAPFGLAKRLSLSDLPLNIDELSDDSMLAFAGCVIKMKVNPRSWMTGMESYVMASAERLSQTEGGFKLLCKVVFAVCNNTMGSEEMARCVQCVLEKASSELVLSSAGVQLLWCCSLCGVYPIDALRILFKCPEDTLLKLSEDNVRFLNDLHWLHKDGQFVPELVSAFGPRHQELLTQVYNKQNAPRKIQKDFRMFFNGASRCLFDTRTRENFTIDIAALRSSTSYDFVDWTSAGLHPSDITDSKMANRRNVAAEAVLLLGTKSYVSRSHFPLGWARMQKRILTLSGWDVTFVSSINLQRSTKTQTEALKERMDIFHEKAVMHCHGRKRSSEAPREKEVFPRGAMKRPRTDKNRPQSDASRPSRY